MATPYSGRTFYTSPGYRDLRLKMGRFLRYFHEDRPVGTWSVVSGFLGGRIEGLTPREARHKCHRLFRSAEAEGFITRLPTRVASSAPSGDEGRLVRKELSWKLTKAGAEYRHDMYLECLL